MKKIRKSVQLAFLVLFLFVIAKGNMFIWLGLFLISLIGARLFGRFYCGYICPMNTVMGVTSKFSKKLNWQTNNVPKFLKTRWLPWLVLLLMVISMILAKKILKQELPILIILMVISVVVTFRYEKWVFHNHFCPYGALLSLTGKRARFSTEVDSSLCIGCKKCESICPSKSIVVDDGNKVAQIDKATCHQCQKCTSICPVNAIHYKRKGD